MIIRSETEQSTPPLSKWVHDQGSQEETNGDTNRDLDD
jgi:hypothetical protein